MSELKALTSALRSFDRRIAGIEECLIIILRNSEQESDWRHEQRGLILLGELARNEQETALKQLQEFQGSLWKYLSDLDTKIQTLSVVRHDDIVEIKKRLRAIETTDEVTKP